jgi:hypothetical protein
MRLICQTGDELMDEDDFDYEPSDEDLSDIDDSELLKRLEAKYGKISDKSNEEENDDGSWTSKCLIHSLFFC